MIGYDHPILPASNKRWLKWSIVLFSLTLCWTSCSSRINLVQRVQKAGLADLSDIRILKQSHIAAKMCKRSIFSADTICLVERINIENSILFATVWNNTGDSLSYWFNPYKNQLQCNPTPQIKELFFRVQHMPWDSLEARATREPYFEGSVYIVTMITGKVGKTQKFRFSRQPSTW